MAWFLLVLAGILEIVWAYFMKRSAGFTLFVPTAITVGAMVASFALLAAAMKTLPLGTAYAVWTGIGAVGAFLICTIFLGEALTLARAAAMAMILAGIATMKLAGS